MSPKETQQETPDAPTLEDALGPAENMAEQIIADAINARIPSLREKLSRVAAHCAYVQKGGVNEFHGYPYAMASQVFAKVNEALIENRLTSVPRFSIASVEGGLVTVKCTLLLFDIDSEEKEAGVLVEAFGSGMDKGDKAVMKAQTAALKYAWMMLLNISTGDDPEADSTTDSRAHGEPVKPRQTPEEYAARVERNKAAKLSPLGEKAIDLADLRPALKESIKKVREEKAMWPDEVPPVEAYSDIPEPEVVLDDDRCGCGSPLITKTVTLKGKKVEAEFCELADLASGYEYAVANEKDPKPGTREAFNKLTKLKFEGKHVKFRPIP